MSTITEATYQDALKAFDAATCEAIAVSQSAANRFERPTVGLSTHVFARICQHSVAAVNAAPKSRWARKSLDSWDVSAIAAHIRSVLEGYLLFHYLADAKQDDDTQRAYVQSMHLYDCKKRLKILGGTFSQEEKDWFHCQEKQIVARLNSTELFRRLKTKEQRAILNGQHMMITPKSKVIADAGIAQEVFDFHWNYLSQYTHVLSFSFYRMEPDGRGTGLKNEFDDRALTQTLLFGAEILEMATNKMVEKFPEAKGSRRGTLSQFSPGPLRNSLLRTIWLRWGKLTFRSARKGNDQGVSENLNIRTKQGGDS